jgi:hypothetical protein
MENGDLNWIANFIRGIADDVLREGCRLAALAMAGICWSALGVHGLRPDGTLSSERRMVHAW